MLNLLFACAHVEVSPEDSASEFTVEATGATLHVVDGRFAPGQGGPTIGLPGRWIVPAFIDSHVHLAYLPEGDALASGGIAGAVDLASPRSFLAEDHAPLRVLAAGPMVTAVGGYPTASWGRNGYGESCDSAGSCAALVDSVLDAGAGLIKLPVTDAPVLDDASLAGAVAEAHARGVKVVSHALYAEDAERAVTAGVDVLAHTPVETIDAGPWAGRAVISTLAAFGGGATTVGNLAALRKAGATVLYGTDFGNTRAPGIDPDEIELMMAAGMDGAAIVAAGTSTPAAFWGFDTLGSLDAGKAGSFLVLDADPLVDPTTLGRPVQVWIDGARRK